MECYITIFTTFLAVVLKVSPLDQRHEHQRTTLESYASPCSKKPCGYPDGC